MSVTGLHLQDERIADLRRQALAANDNKLEAANKLASHLLACRHHALDLDQALVDQLLDEFSKHRRDWTERMEDYMQARHDADDIPLGGGHD